MTLVSGRVLITGATGGIGHAITRAFAQRGAQLLLTGRNAEALASLAAEVGGRAIVCDLSVREDVERLAHEASAVDVLVANAGVPATGELTTLSQDRIDRILEVNLRAPITLARALAPVMIERGRGHMVFISSLSGKAASPASSLYVATKFGLRGFALSVREDFRPHGVGASVVLPGFIRDAGMFAESGAKLPPGVGTRSPSEVADAVIAAIERNRAEIDVAPVTLRLGAKFASAAPQIAAAAQRLMGANKIAGDLASGHSRRGKD